MVKHFAIGVTCFTKQPKFIEIFLLYHGYCTYILRQLRIMGEQAN
jgi:hypothetical protein